MSKKGRKQNKERRATTTPQVGGNDAARMLSILRTQDKIGRGRGETQPLRAWIAELKQAASRAAQVGPFGGFDYVTSEDPAIAALLEQTPVRVGDYGEFAAQEVLIAIRRFEEEAR